MNDKPLPDNAGQRTVTGSFECSLQLSTHRTMRVTGYFFSDDTLEEMNQRVDLAQAALDRQFIKSDIINKEAQIEAISANIDQMTHDFQALRDRQTSGKKIPTVDQQKLASFQPTLDTHKRNITLLQAAIEKGKQKINGIAHS